MISNLARLCLALPLLAWCNLAVSAERPAKASLPQQFDIEGIDTFLAQSLDESGMAGMSVAIMKDGKLVLSKAYGVRSVKDRSPLTPDTRFAIGSVTKQFTCACILLLAEQGKLSVSDKVSKYYPTLTKASEITLLDLMHPTSGYPDYYPLDFIDRKMSKPIDTEELIRQFAGGKLDFEPGTRFSYSNTGYIILGRIIEKVSGQSMEAFLNEQIFKPLGMTSTVYDPEKLDTRYALGHSSFSLGPLELVPRESREWLGAAGGIFSTASDLMKWNLALMEGKLLKPASYEIFSKARQLANGKSTGYGTGVDVNYNNGYLTLAHGGAVSGYSAWNCMLPSVRGGIVFLSNQEVAGRSIRRQLLSLLVRDESTVPKITGSPALDAAKSLLRQMQDGKVDRDSLGEEFNIFLTDEKIQKGASTLKPLGEPQKVEVVDIGERGGMEVSTVRFTFKSQVARGLLYRTPDGKIQEFIVYRE